MSNPDYWAILDKCLKRIESDIQRTCTYSTREIRVVQALEALRECVVWLHDRIDTLENANDV